MAKKQKAFSFFTALFLTFGITSLNFDDLEFAENLRGYISIIIGLILLVFFFIVKRREDKLN